MLWPLYPFKKSLNTLKFLRIKAQLTVWVYKSFQLDQMAQGKNKGNGVPTNFIDSSYLLCYH